MAKKIFKVPCAWEMYGHVEVEAKNEEEAIRIAQENINEFPLPKDGEYLEGSFEIDTEGIVLSCEKTPDDGGTPQKGEKIDNELLWNILKEHWGHEVEIAFYCGPDDDPDDPVDICLEDMDTYEVILDAELYTVCAREDLDGVSQKGSKDGDVIWEKFDNELLWNILKEHWGHEVEIAFYSDTDNPDDDPVEIRLEDMDTNEVILDAGLYTVCAREDLPVYWLWQ